ncbi:MAG: polyprenyl synthetase family protein [Bacillota bacterium]
MIDIGQYMDQKKNIIDLALAERVPQSGPTIIIDAMRHSLEAGGKRLRPILVLAAADTLGSEDSSIIEVACALEYIHTYSLIHDDLPAMDNSDLRRGKPSCHRVFGEALAILAGDALLTLAFELVANYGRKYGREGKALEIITILAEAAGVTGMIGGQVLDLKAEGTEPTLEEIESIAEMKTGALLKAAVLCGAIAADATSKQLNSLNIYASNIGPAFQIIDDLLDYEGTTEELGKPAGVDQTRFKATYPALLGQAEARQRADLLYTEALKALDNLDCNSELLSGLAEKMIYRTR